MLNAEYITVERDYWIPTFTVKYLGDYDREMFHKVNKEGENIANRKATLYFIVIFL